LGAGVGVAACWAEREVVTARTRAAVLQKKWRRLRSAGAGEDGWGMSDLRDEKLLLNVTMPGSVEA